MRKVIPSWASFAALAAMSAIAYVVIALSGQSLHEEGSGGHSLLVMLGLFGICFACYLAAVSIAVRSRPDGTSLAIIVVGALVFRGLLLFCDPIEEIDIYRYLWDGAASTSGANPFRYAPQQVLAVDNGDILPGDLAKLVALRDRSPALAQILSRVHFGELPTIYPPVSQVVFAAATAMTPATADLRLRMTIMKAWFVSFDLLTIVVVLKLLRLCGRPDAAVVIYAWCPLVVKEFANSGHLDSLAVFLTALSCSIAAKSLFPSAKTATVDCGRGRISRPLWAAFFLGLAVGAKLYPAVLVPLLLGTVAARRGWRDAIASAFVFLATTACVLYPMLPTQPGLAWKPPVSVEQPELNLPPLPPEEIDVSPRDPSQSLRAFLSYWEMNDFLFLLVMENVRPTAHVPPHERAWFSIVPERWREALCYSLAELLRLDPDTAPFIF
ncbi:MAG TPA: glycosyltransferase family 87 protein, partial [Pirellulales bacterium]|nr:glycosyltransferase family 87 protein [Pirellulales bacterium]